MEHIEAAARYSVLSPLHDIRPDQAQLRRQMEQLSAEIARYGEPAAGPGHYALGRGYLALGDAAQARIHLELAWQKGFQEPRAAYALALVLVHAYQTRLREAERIEQKELLDARKVALANEYRAPLLLYLTKSRGANVPSEAYVSALIAFVEDRFEEALAELDHIDGTLPWFYEAPALRAEVLRAKALQHRLAGDRAGAVEALDAGRQAYLKALAIGESAPELHRALAELEYSALLLELYGHGNVTLPFQRGVDAVTRALRIQPDAYGPWVRDAMIRRRLSEYHLNRGEPVDGLLAQALASAQKAVALDATGSEALLELGRIYWQQANALLNRGQDPSPLLQQALDVYARIQTSARDYDYHRQLGLIHDVWAEYQQQTGADPQPHWRKAIDAFRLAVGLNARLPSAWINLGTVYFLWGNRPQSTEPDAALEQAGKALAEARRLDPGNTVAYYYGAETLREQARRLRLRGGDGRALLNQALGLHREGSRVNPSLPHLLNGAGGVLVTLAQEAWEHGEDPQPVLQAAGLSFEQASRVAPEQGYAYHNKSEMYLQLAGYRLARGLDASTELTEAEAANQEAQARLPAQASPWVNLARVQTLRAELFLRRGLDPTSPLRAASAAVEKGLALNPSHELGLLCRADIAALHHRWKLRQGRSTPEDLQATVARYQAAHAVEPEREAPALRLGWLYWHQAVAGLHAGAQRKKVNSGEVLAALDAGLSQVEGVLKMRPGLAEALLLRGALLHVKVRALQAPEAQRQVGQEAQSALDAAFKAQHRLKEGWERLRQQLDV